MTYLPSLEEWLALGRDMGYCSEVVCATHQGVPSTPEERDRWDDGYDPCEMVVRIW